jgi:lipoate synthase
MAEAVTQWGVDYIVLTSVDRDDIPDGGAQHFAHTVELLKRKKPELLVECIVSDFQASPTSVEMLTMSGLDVYAHNVETVERLQKVRSSKLFWGCNVVCRFASDLMACLQHFAHTVELLKCKKPELLVECIVSDFQASPTSVEMLAVSGLDVYAHNVETVERLQKVRSSKLFWGCNIVCRFASDLMACSFQFVRDHRAGYQQSLFTLEHAKKVNPGLYTKTRLMLGLGETDEEVIQTMKVRLTWLHGNVSGILKQLMVFVFCSQDLRAIGVDVVTFGQYLRPTENHLSVVEYVRPEKFDYFHREGEEMGFKYVASGPMVRSSYKAGEFYLEHMIKSE